MQEPIKKMNIHITLGQQDGLQFLTDTNTTVTSNPTLVQNIIADSQFKQDIGNDMILVFHFYVQQGKQKQAVAYFQQALDQGIQEDKMSPIQKLFRRPNNKGTVDIIETPGCIIINYRFFSHQVLGEEDLSVFQTQLDKYQKATFNFSSTLKGHLKHNNKNRTNVKVDYVDLKIHSDEIAPSDFSKLFTSMQIQEQDKDFLMQIPALQMIGNLKSADFEMKLASFRQIKSFYNKACSDKFQKHDKPFPYTNRGIFRKQINIFGLFKNKIGIKVDASYNGQDVLMRLVKVWQVFIFQGLGI